MDDVKVALDPKPAEPDRHEPAAGNLATHGAPNQWTYRVVAKHVLTLEQDSLKTIAADRAARTSNE